MLDSWWTLIECRQGGWVCQHTGEIVVIDLAQRPVITSRLLALAAANRQATICK
ncbi:hypothetical protein DSCO28_30230 [Desulfosarcina ovata subsp. sediminis]|uniref:Uncharacterized protein n=1 Tax=Desulfosarcina ovata subsp. sediminis TaxID=885957 RepID=A0A5K7ZPF3_9BACT|nr:hypothetical protein [Desulfosarcina ovata]BBO82457.1 hypothetical protein DSCO28_30230 [Desulfosarcina ovata subsp. sediminis]